MNFYSICDLRSETKNICEKVRQSGEVVITNNGKPSVLMLDISEDNFDEIVQAIRQAKAMIAHCGCLTEKRLTLLIKPLLED